MTDREGIKAFEAFLKVYSDEQSPPPWTTWDMRESWTQGVAWGRQHPEENEGIGLGGK